jgi:hypothetical protein
MWCEDCSEHASAELAASGLPTCNEDGRILESSIIRADWLGQNNTIEEMVIWAQRNNTSCDRRRRAATRRGRVQ